jgi:hypothetical protein
VASDDSMGMCFLLPRRVWKRIFQLAAGEPPCAFDTSALPALSSSGRSWTTPAPSKFWQPKEYDASKKRAQTRVNIFKVSKQWRNFSADILYENVVLRTLRATDSFSESLENSAASAESGSTGHPPLGSLIKRLQITFPEIPKPSDPNKPIRTPNRMKRLIRALQFCTNLEVLIVESTKALPAGRLLLESIAKHKLPIRHLRWDSARVLLDIQKCQPFDTIQVLSLSSIRVQTVDPSVSGLSFPRLHTLEILDGYRQTNSAMFPDSLLMWVSRWRLPALRRVTVHSDSEPDDDGDHLSFFRKFGSQITSLGYRCSQDGVSDLATILKLCTSLEDLAVSSDTIGYIADEEARRHPTLARVGIYLALDDPPMPGRVGLPFIDEVFMMEFCNSMTTLFRMKSRALKTVWFPDFDLANFSGWQWRQTHIDFWEECIEFWDELGIQFLFSDGERVKIPFDIGYYSDDEDAENDWIYGQLSGQTHHHDWD